jgi:hypothetical protein
MHFFLESTTGRSVAEGGVRGLNSRGNYSKAAKRRERVPEYSLSSLHIEAAELSALYVGTMTRVFSVPRITVTSSLSLLEARPPTELGGGARNRLRATAATCARGHE